MPKVVVGASISLDGFFAEPDGGVGPLYPDLVQLQGSPYMEGLKARAGAVVMGRRTFEMGDPDTFADDYEYQVPIFVVTHHPPERQPKENHRLTFTFVSGGAAPAVAQAKIAAGDRDVHVVGGADLVRQLVAEGLVDELRVDVMPVIIGAGRRFFDGDEWRQVRLKKLGVEEAGSRTSILFRVAKDS